ncbi:MAG: SRPBCC domain-containing protein [Myxococcales bacterium]|nr:SRPBCC domain-containing protein [Myxococcales bacterium]
MRFATRVTIQAPAEAVWALLTDAAAYPAWNPTVASVEGTIGPGGKVTVRTAERPGQAFPVRVTAFEAPRRMVWTGGMPLGLFKGERTFTVTPEGNGVVFAMEEVYTGLMAPLITRSIPDLQPDFDRFGQALKAAAEQGA